MSAPLDAVAAALLAGPDGGHDAAADRSDQCADERDRQHDLHGEAGKSGRQTRRKGVSALGRRRFVS